MRVDRSEIKERARYHLQGRVFRSFLVGMLPSLLPSVIQLMPGKHSLGYVPIGTFMGVEIGLSLPFMLLGLLIAVFVTAPMQVRVAGYFTLLDRKPGVALSPGFVFDCFGKGYWRSVRGMLPLSAGSFCMSNAMVIWLELVLLQVSLAPGEGGAALSPQVFLAATVVGTVIMLSFAMTPYRLFDRPELSARDALRESLQMMRGHKWAYFVLQMSFMLWILLITLTFGLAAIFVLPYVLASNAAFYVSIASPPSPEDAGTTSREA